MARAAHINIPDKCFALSGMAPCGVAFAAMTSEAGIGAAPVVFVDLDT
ncbi:MAG: hypothetical protein GY896_02310 [Gammaproteobacteria bacterium]|nr:hypothetical protein [Gammaproteobacteria bacterium]